MSDPTSRRQHGLPPLLFSLIVTAALLASAAWQPAAAQGGTAAPPVELKTPEVVLPGLPFAVVAAPVNDDGEPLLLITEHGRWEAAPAANGSPDAVRFEGVTAAQPGVLELRLERAGQTLATTQTRAIPGFVSVLPPLLAIAIALLTRSVVPALFLGAWLGAFALGGMTPGAVWTGLLAVFERHVRDAVANPDHAAIMLFSLMIGGLVGVITRNGGMEGVVSYVVRWASNARRGQLATAVLGLAIFVDDYANTLVVGNTMRPVTDSLRISRQKLAFLVDATAAPVACVALITTWVGYEVGLIDGAVANLPGFDQAPYLVYLNSIPYSFYPLLMMLFVLLVAGTGRDFGPMLRAEQHARVTGEVDAGAARQQNDGDSDAMAPPAGRPRRALNAIVPLAVLIIGVVVGLFATGEGDTLVDVIGSADSYKALMWGSLAGVLVAISMSLAQRLLSLEEAMLAWLAGVRAMLLAMIILVLAWTLGSITEGLHAGSYLASLLGDFLPPALLPALIFVLAAMTAFATGTSWGTMGILLPLAVPLCWAVLTLNGIADAAHLHLLYASVASVLSGAVWGDHSSPISDTTILSSMASGCDHVEHVTTQLPYAGLVGGCALLLCLLPAGFGVPWWIVLPIAAAVILTALRVLGRTTPSVAPSSAAAAFARGSSSPSPERPNS